MGKCFCLVRKNLVCCIGVREPLSALSHVVKSPRVYSVLETCLGWRERLLWWKVLVHTWRSRALGASIVKQQMSMEQLCPCLSHVSVLQHCLSSLKADLPKTGLKGPGVLDSARWLKWAKWLGWRHPGDGRLLMNGPSEGQSLAVTCLSLCREICPVRRAGWKRGNWGVCSRLCL